MKKKKNSNKKRATIVLSIIWAVVLFLSVFSVLSITGGLNEYHAPISQIELGLEFEGSVYAVLDAKTMVKNDDGVLEDVTDVSEKLDKAVKIIQERLRTFNLSDASVKKTGDSAVRIELPPLENATSIINAVAKPSKIEICKPHANDSSKAGDVVVSNEHIKKVKVVQKTDGFVVEITLTKSGSDNYYQATYWANEKGKDLKIWIDGVSHSDISVSKAVTDGKITIKSDSEDNAKVLKMQLDSGAFDLTFNAARFFELSPKTGEDAIRSALITGVLAIVLIAAMIFIFYRYFGFAANLSLLVFAFLFVIMLATLPWVEITLGALVGIILSFMLFTIANVSIFERIKEEYASGKSLVAACEAGFKKSLAGILDIHAVVLLVSIAFWVLGSVFVSGFAVTLFIGTILSAFCTLVLTRFGVNRMLVIDNKSAKKYKLSRDTEVDYE